MTLVVLVARRVPQKPRAAAAAAAACAEPPVSAGSSIRGVELPKAKTMCERSFLRLASMRASRSWFLRSIASRLSRSASQIRRLRSSTWLRLRIGKVCMSEVRWTVRVSKTCGFVSDGVSR